MKRSLKLLVGLLLCGNTQILLQAAQAGNILDRLTRKPATQANQSDETLSSGLKEALQVGTANAVALTSKTDGFYKNSAIKILLPEKLKTAEKVLRAAGMADRVDEFELSMNRAAEKAAPEAKTIFLEAVKSMTFTDVRGILTGGNTAATDYFKSKTATTLTSAFRPIVKKATDEAGVTRQYKQLVVGIPQLPFLKKDNFDVDEYVVAKSLDGLFHVLAEEEKKIRTDPAAQVTSLLKQVFGKR